MESKKLDKKSIEFRKKILLMVERSRRGHIGSALSVVEIIRVLYEDVLSVNPKNAAWQERDRFILSKGHGCLALYAALAERGFIGNKELSRFCEFDSILGGHPQYGKVPGVEASTGSLGHGLSIGVGVAINGRIERKDYRTFVLMGDGECNEGSIWEAAMCASKHGLNRLIAIIDYNKMQCYGPTCEVQDLEPFADKWRSFGFNVKEVDGHDLVALRGILKNTPFDDKKPQVIICHTIKGKGVHSLESHAPSHHKSRISDEEMKGFFKELELSR